MQWFEWLEELGIVNEANGTIKGCLDEWVDGIQLGNKLRLALCFEEDDNYEVLKQDKYSNEFIFALFKFLALGGGMSQFDVQIAEYLECTKAIYKDLVTVAKDQTTGEIQAQTMVFKVLTASGQNTLKGVEHP